MAGMAMPYLGFGIFQKQVTQWVKSGDMWARNKKNCQKSNQMDKKQVSSPLPSLPK